MISGPSYSGKLLSHTCAGQYLVMFFDRQEMSGRYQLGSKELKEVLRLEVQSVEERHKMQVSSYQEK